MNQFCRQCGSRLLPDLRFCEACGTPVSSPAGAPVSSTMSVDVPRPSASVLIPARTPAAAISAPPASSHRASETEVATLMSRRVVRSKAVYRLSVSLDECQPAIWRRLLVQGRASLHRLHEIIQVAMGWTNTHLYEFQVDGHRYTALETLDGDDGSEDARRITLAQAAAGPGDEFKYLYDFGDDWLHTVTIEGLESREVGAKYPLCVAGARASPPEDCGGVWGYFEFLEARGNPAHAEHETMHQWIRRVFDPEAFDADRINRLLARRSQRVGWTV